MKELGLKEAEEETLKQGMRNHPGAMVRERMREVILRNQGKRYEEIGEITGRTRQSASSSVKRWKEKGLVGLYNEQRPGRPRDLSSEEETWVRAQVEKYPRCVRGLPSQIEKHYGKQISLRQVKETLKRDDFRWKRTRKSLKTKRNEGLFREAQEEL